MRKDVPTAAEELAAPWARRRWSGVEQMTVRGRARRNAAPNRGRPVAGRRAARNAVAAAGGRPTRPRRAHSLAGRAPLFATRVAGHGPEPRGLLPPVRLTPTARGPEQHAGAPFQPALAAPPTARHRVPITAFPTEPAGGLPWAVRLYRPPVPPGRRLIASAGDQSRPARPGPAATTRLRYWLPPVARRRSPRELDWSGWRARMEPALLASFAVMACAAALIALYSFSNGGMYHPTTPIPSRPDSSSPGSPPGPVAPGVRAIQKAATNRSPESNAPSVPQAYASWPAPSSPSLGSAPASTAARSGAESTVTGPSTPGGGGAGGNPVSSPVPSITPTPSASPSDTTTSTPTDTTTPTPSDTTTPTSTAGP